jgi:ATP-dependent DNA ligase
VLFSEVAQAATNIDQATPEQTVKILTDLFQQADFGEASLLVALCGQHPNWDIRPWLSNDEPEAGLRSTVLPKPHTLARVFREMQTIAGDSSATGLSRRHVLLTSLAPPQARVAEQLLAGQSLAPAKALESALNALKVRAGGPVLPETLVRRTSVQIEQVWQKLGASYGHVKDDGYYCQLHKQGDRVLIFVGVNLLEQTRHYPEIVKAGQNLIEGEAAILEGELVGLDSTGRVLSRRYMPQATRYQVRLFDLLSVNDDDLRPQPYQQRREKRLALVAQPPETAALGHALEFTIDSFDTLVDLFDRCQAENWEGVVVKQVDAPYRSGQRNPRCIKLKRVEPVDATIVGMFLGPAGQVEAFLLALYNGKSGRFEACGRTKAGLSKPACDMVQALVTAKTGRDPLVTVTPGEEPDVWVEPRYVFEFSADYRYATDRYPCTRLQSGQGWALQNPVFQSSEPRRDKAVHHTTPIDQFLELPVETGQISSHQPEQPAKISSEQLSLFDS